MLFRGFWRYPDLIGVLVGYALSFVMSVSIPDHREHALVRAPTFLALWWFCIFIYRLPAALVGDYCQPHVGHLVVTTNIVKRDRSATGHHRSVFANGLSTIRSGFFRFDAQHYLVISA